VSAPRGVELNEDLVVGVEDLLEVVLGSDDDAVISLDVGRKGECHKGKEKNLDLHLISYLK